MPIHLRAPEPKSGGPDGKGWNRLSLNAHMGQPNDQCALRPRTVPAFFESQDTRHAKWGAGFGICTEGGQCDICPIYKGMSTSRTLRAFTDRVLVRISSRGQPHLMNRPEQGWGSSSQTWSWDDLARLQGWELGGRHVDEHSDGFWLLAVREPAAPSPPPIPAPRSSRMTKAPAVRHLPCPDCGETSAPVTCSDHPGCPKCTSCGFCDMCALASA